jgi:hypothetical protein
MPSPTVPGQPEYPNQPVAWPDVSSWKRLTSSFARFGRPRLRRQALEMLIAVSDLPGPGWRELGTGSSRVGVGGNSTGPIAERARKTGEFTAQRRFRNDQTDRGVMVQVLPLANDGDATAQVNAYPSSVIRWSGVTTLEERMIEDVQVPLTDNLVAWERLNEREGYGRGYSRNIAANVDRTVFSVHCSSMGEGCQWSEVISIASSQAEKLHRALGLSEG